MVSIDRLTGSQTQPVYTATAESAKTLTGLVTANNANKIATRLVRSVELYSYSRDPYSCTLTFQEGEGTLKRKQYCLLHLPPTAATT